MSEPAGPAVVAAADEFRALTESLTPDQARAAAVTVCAPLLLQASAVGCVPAPVFAALAALVHRSAQGAADVTRRDEVAAVWGRLVNAHIMADDTEPRPAHWEVVITDRPKPYRTRLVGANGEVVLYGQHYRDPRDAEHAIALALGATGEVVICDERKKAGS